MIIKNKKQTKSDLSDLRSVVNMKKISCSPRKLRLITDLIRTEKVEDSILKLNFIKKKGSILIKKILLSAMANWKKKNFEKDIYNYNFYIEKILVNKGTQFKKIRPAHKGIGVKIRKRYSNIYITIIGKINYGTYGT
ncbi:large ribosomal subunit protein uL22 [Candidatus Karelsulcia muelleri]|uniref:large ribosomal subunit protein uL22 n=1 Tax=Candidatus Karelsulcia muelleri TaxID=336810 RepID=UPI000D7CF461|nr:uL22 family ribosomal protein [Candidatus Karelsulcia muelleri]